MSLQRIDNADYRLAVEIGRVEAALSQARAVAERAQIVDAEPAMTAQLFRKLPFAHSCGCTWSVS